MSSLVEVDDVHLSRGGRPVLSGVTATFDGSFVTAIVGPSGAGKTSLLRCINRLEEPERGRVSFGGRDVRSIAPTELRRRVGMIFQTPVLFPGGVRANLRYGLPEVSDDGCVEALDAAGLPPVYFDRESSALSVGQAQRVCIARALVRRPEMLLMDEPTSALDKDASARIESLIVSLAAGGLGVVVVTHNLGAARAVAGRALLLSEGRVLGYGTPEEIEGSWPREAPS